LDQRLFEIDDSCSDGSNEGLICQSSCGRLGRLFDFFGLLPSSQAALRPPGPLRTGREGFPSPSSSPSNASLEETRFRNGKTLTMNPVMALGMK